MSSPILVLIYKNKNNVEIKVGVFNEKRKNETTYLLIRLTTRKRKAI